ncbi:hypothetical protein DICVIV_04997 [Dictyocaulus viviparus]|uniref:Uncharacterized protein n=1 Tax=Dictyocaulus viviparus TaxID=29172 RepID=A0A0D8Y2S4_DICVI|nr:hypothetical protein DICVIV_04997 [Dictyocaulus viviparus]
MHRHVQFPLRPPATSGQSSKGSTDWPLTLQLCGTICQYSLIKFAATVWNSSPYVCSSDFVSTYRRMNIKKVIKAKSSQLVRVTPNRARLLTVVGARRL